MLKFLRLLCWCTAVTSCFDSLLHAQLIVSTTPDKDTTTDIELSLAPGASDGSFSLFLRNPGDKPLKGISALGVLTKDNQILPKVKVEISPLDSATSGGKWDLASGGLVPLRLQVKDVPEAGTYSGSIFIRVAEDNVADKAFKLIRPGKSQLRILEADEKSSIRLRTNHRLFQFNLTLLETSGELDADNVELELGPLTRSDGAAGKTPEIKFATDANKSVTIPKHGKGTITLVGELPESVEYRGWLSYRFANHRQVFDLFLTRVDATRFEILEAEQGVLNLIGAGRDVSRPITLRLAAGQIPIDDLALSFGPVAREDGRAVPKDTFQFAEKGKLRLAPGESKSLFITANHLEPGTYLSTVRLESGGQIQSFPLKLKRDALSSNLAILDPGTSRINASGFWTTAETKFSITDNTGRATTIYPATLEFLRHLDADTAYQVAHDSVALFRVIDGKDQPILPDGSDPSNHTPTDTVPANGTAQYKWMIGGLGPGRYQGRLAVSGPDHTRLTKDFEILVRHHCYIAFPVILIGIFLAFGLQKATSDYRVKKSRDLKLVRAIETLAPLKEIGPRPKFWKTLEDRLNDLRRRNYSGDGITDEIVTDNVNAIQTAAEEYQRVVNAYHRVTQALNQLPLSLSASKGDFAVRADSLLDRIVEELLTPSNDETAPTKKDLLDLEKAVIKLNIEHAADVLIESCEGAQSAWPDLTNILTKTIARVREIKGKANVDHQNEQLAQLNKEYWRLVQLHLSRLERAHKELEDERAASKLNTDVWSKFDGAFKEFTLQLDEAKRLVAEKDHPAADVLQKIGAASRSSLKPLVEHLAVVVDNGIPEGTSKVQWKLIKLERPSIEGLLNEARDAIGYENEFESYRAARARYEQLFASVVAQNIASFLVQLRESPEFIKPDDWTKARAESSLDKTLEELEGLQRNAQDSMPTALEPEFGFIVLQTELKALEAAHGDISKLFESEKQNMQPGEQSEISELIKQLGEAIQKANQAVKQEPESRTPYDRLAEARSLHLQLLPNKGANLKMHGRPGAQPASDEVGLRAKPSSPAMISMQRLLLQLNTLPEPITVDEEEHITSAALKKELADFDRYIFWVAVLVAGLVGLAALWVPNKTWGSPTDYLTALLWGLGAHETGNAVTEIATLRRVATKG